MFQSIGHDTITINIYIYNIHYFLHIHRGYNNSDNLRFVIIEQARKPCVLEHILQRLRIYYYIVWLLFLCKGTLAVCVFCAFATFVVISIYIVSNNCVIYIILYINICIPFNTFHYHKYTLIEIIRNRYFCPSIISSASKRYLA